LIDDEYSKRSAPVTVRAVTTTSKPRLRQRERARAPDAAARAGDERYFTRRHADSFHGRLTHGGRLPLQVPLHHAAADAPRAVVTHEVIQVANANGQEFARPVVDELMVGDRVGLTVAVSPFTSMN